MSEFIGICDVHQNPDENQDTMMARPLQKLSLRFARNLGIGEEPQNRRIFSRRSNIIQLDDPRGKGENQ